MVYALLYDLPAEYQYRVVFMQRNINEVLTSQSIMLKRSGKSESAIGDVKLAELFKKQLVEFDQWISAQKNFLIIKVNYQDMITFPKIQCERISKFLGGTLDVDVAAAIVDPFLYRNRS